MIGIKLKDKESTIYDGIENFSVEVSLENKEVRLYHNGVYVGVITSVIGIGEEEFVQNVRRR